jgi:hypothetical protein
LTAKSLCGELRIAEGFVVCGAPSRTREVQRIPSASVAKIKSESHFVLRRDLDLPFCHLESAGSLRHIPA